MASTDDNSHNNLVNSNTTSFLNTARSILAPTDFSMLTQIISEWQDAASVADLLSKWKSRQGSATLQQQSTLHILCFNVRGLDRRWGEVCLLTNTHNSDIILLGEVGHIDLTVLEAAFANYQIFYQAGENAHGGVLVMIRNGIPVSRIVCPLPNVCVLDLLLDQTTRIVTLYAPASKTWDWPDLSPLISGNCFIIGDFNVDLETDGEKASNLLNWMDSCSLGPVLPDSNTSLRSRRTIDYAVATGVDLVLQTSQSDTTSDHKPLLGVLGVEGAYLKSGCRAAWSVFSLVLSYTADHWDKMWKELPYNTVYEHYISFLVQLVDRCKSYFPAKKARPSVPHELMKLLAQSRALSFKARRTGDIRLREKAHLLRTQARYELKRFQQDQLAKSLQERHTPGDNGAMFWSTVKRKFRDNTSSLRGFLQADGKTVKDPQEMANEAADYYEKLFTAPNVVRPHPYVDAPGCEWENGMKSIPKVTYPEVLYALKSRKKKQSQDIHGLSPFLLDKIPKNHWHYFVDLFNHSFDTSFIPQKFKEVRMVLLAKKNAICTPDQTRPISLLDSFHKVQEKLFANRFSQVLKERGILPDNQSGFRQGHRLQTRVLLLVEQISSYMANSAPVATVFVDFKSAFDQLWFEGCLGKLGKMGIPRAYVDWIRAWLTGRRAVIEVQGKRSRWFPIERGGPQGSCFTPTLFITYHSDMADFIPGAMSFFFADDLAAVIAGQMGIRFTEQCIDLERRIQCFLKQLEAYSILAVQPINYTKTEAMFSARAICYPNPMPRLQCGEHRIEWVQSFKYLGYWLTTKLGWGNMIGKTRIKTRQRTAVINAVRINGASSRQLRRVLFSTFVSPHFTWLFGLYPLFTCIQRSDLNHLYLTLLKRILRCTYWEDMLFSMLYQERNLDDLCFKYWEKYLSKLAITKDGYLLTEQLETNAHRRAWTEGELRIRGIFRSKRFVPHTDVLGHALNWMLTHGTSDSRLDINEEELIAFALFPESF